MRSSLDYPLVDRAKNPWLDELDAALLGVADRVYEAMAFDLAFVGEETSGYARAARAICSLESSTTSCDSIRSSSHARAVCFGE